MTIEIITSPIDNAILRLNIYAGKILRLPATEASRDLVGEIIQIVEKEFGEEYRKAQFRLSFDQFKQAVLRTKKQIYNNQELLSKLSRVITNVGFTLEENAIDPIRVRTVPHGAHETENSAPAFIFHRDTWLANPQAQINWWIPLHDVSEQETFSLYPGYFSKAIANSSNNFDYAQWVKVVGFNNSYANPSQANLYPTITGDEPNDNEALKFSASAGDIIIFSGAHLHRTNHNSSGSTRFSIDFRTVNLDDHQSNIGAPNADSRCSGSALVDYLQPNHALSTV
jgi:hypothetical protein